MEHTQGEVKFVMAGHENDKGVVGRIDFPNAVAIVTHNPMETKLDDIGTYIKQFIAKADRSDELEEMLKQAHEMLRDIPDWPDLEHEVYLDEDIKKILAKATDK